MEDILASIKKIIAEDGERVATKPRKSAGRENRFEELGEELKRVDAEAAAEEAAPEEPEEVLELTDSVAETAKKAEEIVEEEAKPVLPPQPAAALTASLVSNSTETASRNALAHLSALIVKPEVTGSDTLEGMVRELLRPMLQQWLDAKLPEIVESAVAKEVARISGRTA
jgi:uncharacterized protein